MYAGACYGGISYGDTAVAGHQEFVLPWLSGPTIVDVHDSTVSVGASIFPSQKTAGSNYGRRVAELVVNGKTSVVLPGRGCTKGEVVKSK
jgi:hypothetical protein